LNGSHDFTLNAPLNPETIPIVPGPSEVPGPEPMPPAPAPYTPEPDPPRPPHSAEPGPDPETNPTPDPDDPDAPVDDTPGGLWPVWLINHWKLIVLALASVGLSLIMTKGL
jgi:hypothetical protein